MEPKNEKVPGIKESYRLLTFEYAFRQVGFIVLLAIILAAMAGLFSSGLVSDEEKTNSANSLTLNYERFGRRQTESRMALTFPVTSEGKYTLSLTSETSDTYEPGSVWPQPDSMYSRGNTLFLVYDRLKQTEKFTVLLFITPSKAGKWTNSIRVNNEPDISFWQFIYP
ncbi:TPA: hypothetical protein QCD44_003277 [Enterobacter hormaechei]|uniref:hypothetical protein n=1 Tax=Enterobacter hormaechei TaxID=158836 RepID=UPI00285537B0|nr:hypothetical protein [Enterobacter hormaechei]ELD3466517.1 hypothetical protein [Enterobacter hormaechei]MED5731490.1 hypothetical protein [Enterobacter hormaechei]HBM2512476.1 hypothetical protein [Enterobacter hormaechei]HBM2522081.1 hypothetical protein [Enterobacter hormaechei]HBM2531246.1 hypothetical protein [Enterobacter hormaechei]